MKNRCFNLNSPRKEEKDELFREVTSDDTGKKS